MKKYFFAVTTILIIAMSLYSFSMVPQMTEAQMALYNEVNSLGLEEIKLTSGTEKSVDFRGVVERTNYL